MASTAKASASDVSALTGGRRAVPLGAVVWSSLAGGLLIVQAWLLAHVADGIVFARRPLDDYWPTLWTMAALFLARAVLGFAADRSAQAAAARVKDRVRHDLLTRLHALGPVGLGGERSGALATLLVDGVEALEGYVARFLPAMAMTVILPLAILAVTLPIDWLSALVMAVTAPLIPFFMVLIGRGAERMNQRQWTKLTRMSARFLDVIQGLTTLKLFNASRREAETVAALSEDYRRETMRILRVAFLSSLALEFLATISIAIIAVFIGFRLLFGEMDYQRGLFLLLLAPEFYLPLRTLGLQYHARMDAIGAAEGLVALLRRPVPERAAGAARRPAKGRVALRFEDVHLRYGDGPPALDGLTFSVAAGERVALVGHSGAGKSSIANLLLRFVEPTAGRILVDGLDLQTLDVDDWRQGVAWVPQRPHLFQGSVADAIALGNPGATRSEVEEAAAKTGADAFIRGLPQGYDTPVGERGGRLSGGQVRRVALARAFLRSPDLVILDEPTASLDRETERLTLQAMGALTAGCTLLTVAHRLESIVLADRVIVLEHGRVVEEGAPDDLRRAGGAFARLAAELREGEPS